jgi:DNA-binding transcriptional MerR regulator
MKVEIEGKLKIESKVKKLIDSVLKLRKDKGYRDTEFDVFVSRYLGKPVVGTNKRLNLSALDLIATSIPKEKQKSVEGELQAFQELLVWSQKLGLNFRVLSGLLELGSEQRSSKLKESQSKIPKEQLDEILKKLDELEKNLSKIDKLIEGYFPDKLNPTLTLLLVEQLENLRFENSHIPAKRMVQLRLKSAELLSQLVQSKGEQAVAISQEKGKIDQELLELFANVEPEKEIRSKVIAWLFAEDSWEKLKDEKYLWTLLARMAGIATRYCNTTWAFIPGQLNLFDLIVNSKWPKYLGQQEKMNHSSLAAKKLLSYPIPEISNSIIFDPFKVDWGLVDEILSEFKDHQLKMYQNSLKAYSNTLQNLLKK